MSGSRLSAKIIGWGKALPEKRLSNFDLERMVDTSDAWILQRVGIRERRIAAQGEYTSKFAAQAAREALEVAGIAAEQLDLIIVATSTPDATYPPTASYVQKELNATHAGVMDISVACTGFIYGASMAWSMIAAGQMKYVMVIGAEVNSLITNWSDRDTCILFGDGAGAAIFAAHESEEPEGILSIKLGGDGNFTHLLEVANSGCRVNPDVPGRFITMQGNEVFKQAVRNMYECAVCVLDRAGLNTQDVSLLIAHQANTRIIDAVAKRLELPPERVFVNIDKYGNTSAATIPIALCEAIAAGRVKRGDVVVMDAFGAGLTWGALAMRWV